MNHLALDTVT